MWRERITNLTEVAVFAGPVDSADVAEAERAFGGQLPNPLVEFLSETDGVRIARVRAEPASPSVTRRPR